MKIKVLIADDHNVVRQGVQTFLGLDTGLEVVGTAINGFEAVEKARQLSPDVILMDIMMPEMDGIEATATIKKDLPGIKVLIFTGVLELSAITRAINAQANGFILKSTECGELCHVIKAVTAGQFLISPEAAQLLSEGAVPTKSLNVLTSRETEVLKFVCKGKANKEIANGMGLSEGTIKTHVSIIIAKLGLQSRTQAALYASQAGFFETNKSNSRDSLHITVN